MTRIAVVGMACRYPDAASPWELWENALAGRRAFRRLPDMRMRLDDYWDPDPSTPDKFYARNAAVIEGYEFDRIGFKVAGSTYRSTDLTHWLALDVAATALDDAGFPMGQGLPGERTGVIVGNSLTGEFSRSSQMRLRWPYVRRVMAAALRQEGWDDTHLANFLDSLEATYKSPFPPVDEDTLAGGLSNTIAGRICNYFDLKGGGYTVDGACSSSLLSVITACRALIDGDVDVALAGGVDLSIDPFEIIGFAKTGALATGDMRVYDRGSNGFWPGEGCGMVVLMREDDARQAGRHVYAAIAGWGISSDGSGGITRPEKGGYELALRRAYEKAGFGIETVSLFEGHGTGTRVGDDTELRALSGARAAADIAAIPAAISSIKAMIGHTKAAAGVAGLIKAAMAVRHEVLPPAIACLEPHELLTGDDATLRALSKAEPWPRGVPVRAGVTAMGFGGINTHVVLDGAQPRRRSSLDARTRGLASSMQDVELLLVDAASAQQLRQRLAELIDVVPGLSYAQLADLAAHLHGELRGRPYRAGLVVSTPTDAERALRQAVKAIDAGRTSLSAVDGRVYVGHATGRGLVGFLFPGQGSGRSTQGGALGRRFPEVEQIYQRAALPTTGDMVATHVAQPRIVTGSLAGMHALSLLDINASVAVGHSLGEITALHWAGAMDADALLRIAGVRGATMSTHSSSGTMAGIGATPEQTAELIGDLPLVIAAYNGPGQTVVAGPMEAVGAVVRRAREAGVDGTLIPVSHAFHSPLVAPAADAFGASLEAEEFEPLTGRVVSTITGEALPSDSEVAVLLHRQITDPVLFGRAIDLAAKDIDLFIEVGPGRVLSGLVRTCTDVPAISLDTDDQSLLSLMRVAAGAFVVGAASGYPALFDGRLTRNLRLGVEPKFFANPCESAPSIQITAEPTKPSAQPAAPTLGEGIEAASTLDLLRRIAAARAELPIHVVREDSRLLDDLHLSSITVGQVVNEVAKQAGIPAAQLPTNFATASIRELADAIDQIAATVRPGEVTRPTIAGSAAWARAWRVDLDELPTPAAMAAQSNGEWQVFAPAGHPLAEALRERLANARLGGGVLVCLPEECPESDLEYVLDGARQALRNNAHRFVLTQHGRGAAGLAKTLRLEAPQIRTTVVHAPLVEAALDWIVAEVAGTREFAESYYDLDGTRRVPTLRALPIAPAQTARALSKDDVLLVTGGGKGITAECALALAMDSGAKLAVLGRSDPAADTELAENLNRMAEAGVEVFYARADVAEARQVQVALEQVQAELGTVTAVLHGAGRNVPAALSNVDATMIRETFAPKVDGLCAVLDALDLDQLRLLVTFGSIIGRAGLRGEAHYAVANEWLAGITEEVGQRYPQCRTLCLEWSVWSGVGMGERLAVVETLVREGIVPMTPEQGVALLRRLVSDPDAPRTVVVSGRTGGIDTVRFDRSGLPLLRFIDRPLIHYPGVELVVETELTSGTDLYLPDHLLDGNQLFPAVFGMEAMAQVAGAVIGRTEIPVIEDAEFLRPIIVVPDKSTLIRIAATVVAEDVVTVVIYSNETGFAAEHFKANLRYNGELAPAGPPDPVADDVPTVPLEATQLYREILFQGRRFQRLRHYHRAAARHVDAALAVESDVDWFAAYLPATLTLGDPGVRDALMHGNQVCIPHGTLLPAGVERIHPAGPRLQRGETVRYQAVERSRDGDTYIYDIVLRDSTGQVVERWEGLKLRAVRKRDGRGPWLAPLLGPYMQRMLDDLVGADVEVAVEPSLSRAGRVATAAAASRALGRRVKVGYRPDGRPEVSDVVLTAAHGPGFTMCAVKDSGTLSCDVEAVVARETDVWQGLLGTHYGLAEVVARELEEDADTAATRVWTAIECLQKASRSPIGPLTLTKAERTGWAVFSSGDLAIATLATTVHDVATPVVCSILIGRGK